MDTIATEVTIVIICNFLGMIIKVIKRIENKYIPLIVGTLGGIIGIVALYVVVDFPASNPISALATGIISGLAAVGLHQCGKQFNENI